MQTVLVTLHGEQLGSVVPAPDGVLPHADIAHHITVRTNDYFGSRSISNMYFISPLLDDGKEVLGYYIVESKSCDDDLVFKLEDMALKRKAPDFIEDVPPPARCLPSLEVAVRQKFFVKICEDVPYICAACSHLQQGGGKVQSEVYTQEGGVYMVTVSCQKCGASESLREEKSYAELFMLLQQAVKATSPHQVQRTSSQND